VGRLVGSPLDYAVDILSRLIEIPTVSPRGEGYREISELLAGELERLGLEARIIEVPAEYRERHCPWGPRFIVLGRLEGGSGRVLHFNGHYDVVPGGPGWRVTDPFRPVVREGRLYGRGAVDMKGGIAAVLGALRLARERGDKPVHTVEVAFVPDEEIGGACGTGYLVESVLDRVPDYVVIPEPSGLAHPWSGHKGLLWVRVRVRGRTAHASTPWLGRNAFLQAASLALRIQEGLAAMLSGRRSGHRFDPPEAARPTFMIGGEAGVPGGGKANQVPGEFSFTIDRRLIPEESVAQARWELESLISWIAAELGVDYSVETLAEMEPAASDPGELFEALRRAAASAGVEVGEPLICQGGLDLHYYTSRGSRALAYGPDGTLAHAPDESISLDELEKLIVTFHRLAFDASVWRSGPA
jgi:succinyl-diaminopimelate desuccinylase